MRTRMSGWKARWSMPSYPLGSPRSARPPGSPGHPTGEHFVLQCLHVLLNEECLNEEWEHHRYTVRDLDVLDPAEAPGS